MKAYKLLDTGLTFLKEALAGGDQLAHELLKLPLEKGEIFTFLPDDVPPERATLQYGFRSNAKPDKGKSPLSRLAASYLSNTESAVVVELKSLTPGEADRFYSQAIFSTFLVENSLRGCSIDQQKTEDVMGVYGFVDSHKWTDHMVRELVLSRWPFGAIGCVTSLRIGNSKRQNVIRDFALIESVVNETLTIIAFAFDDEGWICWTRDHDNAYLNTIRISAEPAVIRLL